MGAEQLEEGPAGVDGGGGVPLRVVATAVAERCRAEGVRPPSLRTLRFWRDEGLIDAPGRLGFGARHLTQALGVARARAAGESLAEIRARREATATNNTAVASDAREGVRVAAVAEGGCDTGDVLGGHTYNGPISCTSPVLGSTVIPGGYPTVPDTFPWLQPYPRPHPQPWETVPRPTTTFPTLPAPVAPHLDRVADAFAEGDAEGALEQLDAVIRDALRDPEADLAGLRGLRACLEDLIFEHRRALGELTERLEQLRSTAQHHDDDVDGGPEGDAGPTGAGSAEVPAGQQLQVGDGVLVHRNEPA